MSPDQKTALDAFLLAALRSPVDFGGPALAFDDAAVYEAQQNAPRAAYPLCTWRVISTASLGHGEQVHEHAQQLIRIRFDTNPIAPFTLTITPRNPTGGGVFSAVSVAVTPGATARDTATATRAALQAWTPPAGEDLPLVAWYDTADASSVLVEARPLALGAFLDVDAGGAADDVSVSVLRDNLLTHVRDLGTALVSVTLRSRLDELGGDPRLHAYQWLERVRLCTMDPTLIEGLRAARCPIVDRSDVRDLDALVSAGAEYVTSAQLDLSLRVHPYRIAQPGTLERVGVSATIAPGAQPLTIQGPQ